MANYLQYRPKADKPKRITWLCGTERVLVEELADCIRRAVGGATSHHQGGVDDTAIWDDLNQHPLDYTEHKLLIVRSAQKIEDWQPFLDWACHLRTSPNSILFISDEEQSDSTQPAQAMALRKGSLVKCSTMAAPALRTWMQSVKPMSDDVAQFIIERSGGSSMIIKDFLAKARLFTGPLSKDVANVLLPASPASEFVHYVVANQKHNALRSLERMGPEHCRAVVGQLDQKLDLLEELYRQVQRGRRGRDLAIHFGKRSFLIPALMPYLSSYPPARLDARRMILASVGADHDSMVALVALW